LQREIKTRLSKPACKKKPVDFSKIAIEELLKFLFLCLVHAVTSKKRGAPLAKRLHRLNRVIAQEQGLVKQR
jgi:hypothetical protein